MRFCPYSERVLIYASQKGIRWAVRNINTSVLFLFRRLFSELCKLTPALICLFRMEVVNINLNSKPDWFIAHKNPSGFVPVLEHDGKVSQFFVVKCRLQSKKKKLCNMKIRISSSPPPHFLPLPHRIVAH